MASPAPGNDRVRGYDLLDQLPESLYAGVATHTHGSLSARAQAVLAMREHLLTGHLPSRLDLSWPELSCRSGLLDELEALDIAAHCRDHETLTDTVLTTFLEAVALYDRLCDELLGEQLSGLEAREAERARQAALLAAVQRGEDPGAASEKGPPMTDRLRADAVRAAEAKALEAARDLLHDRWSRWMQLWSRVAGMLNDLGRLVGHGQDIASAVLEDPQWHEVDRLRALYQKRNAARSQLRTLGRMQSAGAGSPQVGSRVLGGVVRETVGGFDLRSRTRQAETTEDLPPMGPLDRLLAHAPALPAHSSLKRLSLARRALGKSSGIFPGQGRQFDGTSDDGDTGSSNANRRRKKSGPVLVCLCLAAPPTEMASNVARAIALETARLAGLEERACWGYAAINEQEATAFRLGLEPGPLSDLLSFLTIEHPRATRPIAPLQQALADLDDHAWRRADLVIVADVDLGLGPIEKRLIADSRAYSDLRTHGILVGPRAAWLATMCDTVLKSGSWRALERGAGY